ncbi:hypothetical protein HY383_00465 [Candidatus Daviesbacteria bacterium]|nr:hypothetical protein [Candidatus Daviesbacteria bacterium]
MDRFAKSVNPAYFKVTKKVIIPDKWVFLRKLGRDLKQEPLQCMVKAMDHILFIIPPGYKYLNRSLVFHIVDFSVNNQKYIAYLD